MGLGAVSRVDSWEFEMRTLIAIFVLCSSLDAMTVYKSANGKLYRIVDSATTGPDFEEVEVVVLGDDDSDPKPEPDPEDKFGLIERSAKAFETVEPYRDRETDSIKVAALYTGIGDAVEAGTLEPIEDDDGNKSLAPYIDKALGIALGVNRKRWTQYETIVNASFAAAPIDTKEDAATGLRDIGKGLIETNAIDWDKFKEFVEWFIEVILPILISLSNDAQFGASTGGAWMLACLMALAYRKRRNK